MTYPLINNGGTATISNSSAYAYGLYIGYNTTTASSVLIQNGGTLNSQYAYIGDWTNSTGIVTVSGSGSLFSAYNTLTTSTGYIVLGYIGNGTLNITNGGAVSTEMLDIGELSRGTGTVNVNGTGSTLTVSGYTYVGDEGTGVLNVTAGGKVVNTSTNSTYVGYASNASGTITVSGSGSGWTGSSLTLGVYGTGTMTIDNTGTATSSATYLGSATSGTGTLTMSGSGSLLTGGTISVGTGGTGYLNIINGGDASVTQATIGDGTNGVGTATLSGSGSTLTSSGGIIVGNSGTGTLLVSSGAVLSTATVSIGANSTGNGTIILDASPQSWSAVTVGVSGTGALTVTNGTTLTTSTGVIGSLATGQGTATVSGTGSAWVVSGNNLIVGQSGSGTLVLANSGVVTSSTVMAASSSGSIGNIVLTNSSANWTNLIVGQGGTGTLSLSSAAKLTDTTATLGSTVGSSGNATLSGANTIWTVSGTLYVGSAGTGSVLITNQAALRASNIVLGDVAGSTGSITLDGASSTLTYSGTLTVGNNGNGIITLVNGGTLSPSGGSLILGTNAGSTGTLNIGAAAGNAPAAAGYLNAGTINSGSGTGTVQFRHTASSVTPYYFTTDGTSTGTAVNITGATSVVQDAGYTVFRSTGTYNYSGTTTVSGGTLSVAGTLGNASGKIVVNGGTLLDGGAITVATTTISSGVLSVSGTLSSTNLVVTGGNLSASGAITATTTTISGGTAFLDANLTSTNVYITGGTLGLNNTRSIIGNVNVTGGTFATGSALNYAAAPGVVTVSTLTLGSGSTTSLRITNNTGGSGVGVAGVDSDLVRVTGATSLNGNLNVNWNNSNNYIPTKDESFVILQGSSFTGNYSNFTNSLDNYFVFTTGTYSGTNYTLTVSMVQKSFATAASTPNQMAVAQALNKQIGPTSSMQPAIDYINNMPESSWGDALNRLSPEQLTSAPSANLANATSLYNTLGARFNDVRTGQRYSNNLVMWDPMNEIDRGSLIASNGPLPYGVTPAKPSVFDNPNLGFFVTGQGTFGDVSGDSSADGYNFKSGGIILGCDYRIGDQTVIGVYTGYQNTDTDLSNSGNSTVDSGKLGVYLSQWWTQGAWFNLSLGGGYNSYDNKRAALGDFANSSTTGTEFNFQTQQGYDYHMGRWTFGPTLEFDYTHLNIDGYTESGSLAPLTVNSQDADSLQGTIGGRVSTSIDVNNKQWKIMPYANVGLRHEFLDTKQSVTAAFSNGTGGSTFTVDGPKVDSNSVVAGVGLTLQLSPRWSGVLGYFAQANEDYLIQSISGSVVFRF